MKLIICESPRKAKTIQGFLGKEFKVIATKGHIMDLPENELGVDIEKNFTPRYVILPDKQKEIEEIKRLSEKSDEIFIATDPDREGEAIAYHISQFLSKPAKRILLYEIEKEAILNALEEAGEIDMKKVESQKSRRILDRIVGYFISPELWRVFRKNDLSAGRVQSVALRLICEREEKIRKFRGKTYYKIKCKFKKGETAFWAISEKLIHKEEEAKMIKESLKGAKFKIVEISERTLKRKPLPPYTTSSLQEDSAKKLKFSPQYTMKIAQELYEGVEIEGRQIGLITYMRTDSYRISEKALKEVRDFIKRTYGKSYLPLHPNVYKERGKIQGAHEAIRPVYVDYTPELLYRYLSEDQFKLYTLIWRRFVASQMTPAIYETKIYKLKAKDLTFRVTFPRISFDGFLKVYVPEYEILPEEYPELKEGEILIPEEIIVKKEKESPPQRFTEGSLVKELELRGIGRPSTYATIISKLFHRKYVRKERGKIVPTALGEAVSKLLLHFFPDIFDVRFTRWMEENLDLIEEGKNSSLSLLKIFYEKFKQNFERFKVADKLSLLEVKTDLKCPLCGANLLIKWGRYGRFLSCERYPECKYSHDLGKETKLPCPVCGAYIQVVSTKSGDIFLCPNCGEFSEIKTGARCPQCGGELVAKLLKGKYLIYACNREGCKYSITKRPVAVQCPECGNPFMIRKGKKLICPKCLYSS